MLWNELRDRSYAQAVKSGWWDTPRKTEELLMLMISELSEATEEVRNQRPALYQVRNEVASGHLVTPDSAGWDHSEDRKPEGIAVELVDVVIRIADWYGKNKRSLENDVHRLVTGNTLYDLNNVGQGHAWIKLEEKTLAFFFNLTEQICLAHAEEEYHRLGLVCWKISVYFAQRGWDLERVITLKMAYNATRPYRHGGKTA
jgi:hypothetical protein